MSALAQLTNGGSNSMMSTAGQGFPRPGFGMKLLGGESNVTFVKH